MACGTINPGLASGTKTLGAGIDYSAVLAKTAVFDVKRVYFTGFIDFSVKFTRGLLEDSVLFVKTGKFSKLETLVSVWVHSAVHQ